MRIEQPQLALELSAPARVIVGDPLTLVLTVTNPGSSRTSGVVVATTLPEGLETKQGREVRYEVGSLGPGESRAVEVRATAVQAGEHTVQSVASAGSRLRSAADAKIEVMQPQLELKLSGPALRYLSREALYTLHATNPGTAAAKNVRVEATIPDGLQFARAAEGGKHDSSAHTVSWFLGELSPGQSREVQLALVAVGAGSQMLRASAAAQGGLETTGEVMTQVEGISALLLEVVDTDDPVEVGAETLYEIRVTNQGSKRANNVRIVAEIPRGMQAMDYTGPVPAHVEENRIVFDVLGRLEPRADALYRVRVRGIDAGDQRFRAIMTSEMLQSPVVEEESTKVYRD
jgi:uncharacterized repeat protein (TIGR01451 family)